MFHSILVATDGTAAANDAVREAIEVAAQQHAQLTVLVVLDFYAAVADMQMASEGLFERHLQAMHAQGQAILDQAAAQAAASGVPVRVLLREARVDRPADAILDEAAQGYDLVVVGTHGRQGWRRVRQGSEAEEVVRRAHVPVLVVHGEAVPA